MTPLRQRVLDELQRRNYSPATARGYILAIKQFAEYFGKSPERLGGDEIRQFELHLLKLADTEDKVTGSDLVAEGLADLRDTKGQALTARLQNV